MNNAVRFKQVNLGRQKGELARLKVVQGPDYGATYVITGAKAFVGRDEGNDIVISDLKASRIHAELTATATGWMIKDKGSANGILHNGKVTREAKLNVNDTITLGETTLEFSTSDIGTQMLVAPPRSMEQIQQGRQHLEDHRKSLGGMGLGSLFGGQNTNTSAAPKADSKKYIKLALVGGGALFGLLILSQSNNPREPKKKKAEGDRDLAAYLPQVKGGRDVEMIFKDGLREYFAGNYARGRTQFETVLQISPGHTLATFYLENCNNAIKAEVNLHLEQGKKSFDAGRIKEAKSHFARVQRLLFKDQSNPAFIEAKEQLEKIVKYLSEESGS